jgi:phenylacetate-coenzyme A ligase PaaK-like adenylate-forming protein
MLSPLMANYLPAPRRHVEATIVRRIMDAAQHVPYYRELLTKHGLKASEFTSLSDYVQGFPRTPSLEYRRVMAEHGANFILDRRFRDVPLIRLRSSGSSGTPCEFLRTKSEYARIHAANTVHTLVAAGVRPWHKIMHMLPPWDVKKEEHVLQRLGIFRRFDASFTEEIDTILERVVDSGVNVLIGRASMMRALAERVVERKLDLPMQVILPGAEMITPNLRQFLCDVFKPNRYRELYGATETGPIAVRKGNGDYRVNYRYVFFALTRPQQREGLTTGEIAVTSLHAAAAPILMLELGDTVTCRNYDRLLDLRSSIVSIQGRVGDYVLGRNGDKITSAELYGLLAGEPGLRQFRIVQAQPGEAEIQVRGDVDATLTLRLAQHFKGRLSVQVRHVDAIPLGSGGKANIISRPRSEWC